MDGLSEIGKKTKGAMKLFITFVKKEEKKSIWDEKVDLLTFLILLKMISPFHASS